MVLKILATLLAGTLLATHGTALAAAKAVATPAASPLGRRARAAQSAAGWGRAADRVRQFARFGSPPAHVTYAAGVAPAVLPAYLCYRQRNWAFGGDVSAALAQGLTGEFGGGYDRVSYLDTGDKPGIAAVDGWTGRAAMAWAPAEGWRLRAAIGRKIRAATISRVRREGPVAGTPNRLAEKPAVLSRLYGENGSAGGLTGLLEAQYVGRAYSADVNGVLVPLKRSLSVNARIGQRVAVERTSVELFAPIDNLGRAGAAAARPPSARTRRAHRRVDRRALKRIELSAFSERRATRLR